MSILKTLRIKAYFSLEFFSLQQNKFVEIYDAELWQIINSPYVKKYILIYINYHIGGSDKKNGLKLSEKGKKLFLDKIFKLFLNSFN